MQLSPVVLKGWFGLRVPPAPAVRWTSRLPRVSGAGCFVGLEWDCSSGKWEINGGKYAPQKCPETQQAV